MAIVKTDNLSIVRVQINEKYIKVNNNKIKYTQSSEIHKKAVIKNLEYYLMLKEAKKFDKENEFFFLSDNVQKVYWEIDCILDNAVDPLIFIETFNGNTLYWKY